MDYIHDNVILRSEATKNLIGFTVPQTVLDDNETYFLWIILPIMAFLWFRAFIDGMNGN